jgi:hypothetical protein
MKLHNTYKKKQSVVPSNLQKKAKASAIHVDKRRSLNTTKRTCKGNRSFEGLTFPDNLLALFGYRRKNA